ncbi:MAG: ATP-dependent RNA helicase RhlE [Myxococcota bacterium]|jgi:ATP-dependent RNA helicase RhlE
MWGIGPRRCTATGSGAGELRPREAAEPGPSNLLRRAPSCPRDPVTSFEDLHIGEPLLRAVHALGFTTPTPIQVQAIPPVLAGADLVAEAQTGSGKTAAFALPILHRLAEAPSDGPQLRVLVLVPTRELALQVARAFEQFAKFQAPIPRVLAVIGGAVIGDQIAALTEGVDILVATPGRLLDLVDNGHLPLWHVQTLVLDEADKLLDAGFAEELDALLAAMAPARQTLLFSATLPARVLALRESAQRDPVTVRVAPEQLVVSDIAQRAVEVDRHARRGLLQHLFRTESWGQTLVFVATQRATENLAAKLRRDGLSAAALHGGLAQAERTAVLRRFSSGGVAILVATDLASRGIHIPELFAVVNFDLPRSPRDYVHRIGRTGRAGEVGLAVSFIDPTTVDHFRLIEKRAGVQVPRERIAGFEPTTAPAPRQRGAAPVKGWRKSKKDKLREAEARAAAQAEGTAEVPEEATVDTEE